jgi:hypothetical protein
MSSTRSTDDFQLKSSMFHQNDRLWISGRKRWKSGLQNEVRHYYLALKFQLSAIMFQLLALSFTLCALPYALGQDQLFYG